MTDPPIQTRHLRWTIIDPLIIPSGGGNKDKDKGLPEEGVKGGVGEWDDGPPGTLLERTSLPNLPLYFEKQRERRGHS